MDGQGRDTFGQDAMHIVIGGEVGLRRIPGHHGQHVRLTPINSAALDGDILRVSAGRPGAAGLRAMFLRDGWLRDQTRAMQTMTDLLTQQGERILTMGEAEMLLTPFAELVEIGR